MNRFGTVRMLVGLGRKAGTERHPSEAEAGVGDQHVVDDPSHRPPRRFLDPMLLQMHVINQLDRPYPRSIGRVSSRAHSPIEAS